jgi:hypothetical protein
MNQIPITGSAPATYVTQYKKFKGVDMSTDPSQIDNARSSFAPNLISDTGGNPEKRPGWRSLAQVEAPVNGIFSGVIDGVTHFLIHGGTKLYTWQPGSDPVIVKPLKKTVTPPQTEDPPPEEEFLINNARSCSFAMNNRIWILTGKEYLVYGMFDNPNYEEPAEGETADIPKQVVQIKNVLDIAYVPTTIIGRAPTGGGTVFENVNLISNKRKNKFLTTSAKEYQLDSTNIESVDEVKLNGAVKAQTTDYTVDLAAGKVTFTAAMPSPPVAGQDNLEITFTKTVEGYQDKVLGCNISTLFGMGTNDRVFITGNAKEWATDRYCEREKPEYFPDLNYSKVGAQGTRIMGYLKLGEYLAVIKEDNQQDSTIFLRWGRINETTGLQEFPLKQGVNGIGAVSPGSLRNLKDEPLFLARTGIYGISTNAITFERTIQNRSYFIDAKLTKEENLKDAVAVEWNGYYILAINSRCYILDGKQNKSYKPQSYGDYVYECYHWENVPAIAFLEHDGDLYFGTAQGKICRFNTDRVKMDKYSDDGQPIIAAWSTKADDDGDFMIRKTMIKKGSGVMIKPFTRSSVKALVRTEKDFGKEIKYSTMDIFDWEDIDFSRFPFSSNDGPQVVPFGSKVKKYITLQITVKNDGLNEGFGVFGILKRYQKGNYVK